MMVQMEITTRCNFDCGYCVGRLMRQDDMPYLTYSNILKRHVSTYGVPESVSLQGEGEPTLHHDFFRMAEHAVSLGATPYTITNGTYKHPDRFIEHFPEVGVSVDTLDEPAAEKIGRYNLPRVLGFIEALAPHLKIVIHSVVHRQHTERVAAWCRERGFRHVVQPLQTKPDYTVRYGGRAPIPRPVGRFSCNYVANSPMRYYSLDGVELPCCFIKDTKGYEGMSAMILHQRHGTWPKQCLGCRYARQDADIRLVSDGSREGC
jgi:MoaA/NifB/PqqE/SkfB family radical SAM enzyme